ncbi:phosphotransferase enzyme family protein [Luteibacter sahnii]|uniref:phosphotransferase enzyme family protein n=1 Tax=Luteibacter sahnii TaxID=3021977 RepID=UPI002A69F259|nr:aminoglycoside phosphotransferase family protein [Luteibacter sp. PPL193]MDY1547597.1 aminoglycoside phosphotransferase family protein [Luteibacter sp. PPL193]
MDDVMREAACRWLATAWGLRHARLEPIPSGHTNSSFLVHGASGVLRVGWAGKSTAQVARETRMLRHLAGRMGAVAIPTMRATRRGTYHVRTGDGRHLHVFDRIDGLPAAYRRPSLAVERAMRSLVALHAAMSSVAVGRAGSMDWLAARHGRLARPSATFTSGTDDAVIGRIGALMQAARTWMAGPIQWLHGDYHAGNLLFDDDRLLGIVDFDGTGVGSAWLEAAFAAFALARDVSDEHDLRIDASLWRHAIETYADAAGLSDAGWWHRHREDLRQLFCADQVLIHLEAARRGSWSPGPGMGFLGPWRALCAPSCVDSHNLTAATVASRASPRGEASCRHITTSSPRAR